MSLPQLPHRGSEKVPCKNTWSPPSANTSKFCNTIHPKATKCCVAAKRRDGPIGDIPLTEKLS